MAAAIPVMRFAKLHQPLQIIFIIRFRPQIHSQQRRIRIPCKIQESLSWWLRSQNIFRSVTFCQEQPTSVITDASLKGWGPHMGSLHTQNLWSPDDSHLHINYLELKAVFLDIHIFLPHLTGRTIAVHSDNTTVVSYINKQNGTASCSLCWVTIVYSSQYFSCGDTCSRSRQCPCRFPQQGIFVYPRMVDTSVFPPSDIQCLGLSPYRRLHYQFHEEMLFVLLERRNGPNLIRRQPIFRLDRVVSIPFPPLPLLPRVEQKRLFQQPRAILIAPWWL